MSKQTAVDWLWNELKACNVNIASDLVAQFNQAKQMEKEQIAKAFEEGDDWSQNYFDNLMPVGEVYYKQTYGGDHE